MPEHLFSLFIFHFLYGFYDYVCQRSLWFLHCVLRRGLRDVSQHVIEHVPGNLVQCSVPLFLLLLPLLLLFLPDLILRLWRLMLKPSLFEAQVAKKLVRLLPLKA